MGLNSAHPRLLVGERPLMEAVVSAAGAVAAGGHGREQAEEEVVLRVAVESGKGNGS